MSVITFRFAAVLIAAGLTLGTPVFAQAPYPPSGPQAPYPAGAQAPYPQDSQAPYPQGPDGQPPYPQGPGDPQAPAVDPPSRVARLAWIQGPVSYQPAGMDTWTNAALNYPLTTGDHLYTDQGARAELQVGRNSLRLDSVTDFGFLNLDDSAIQIRLTGGAMEFRIRDFEPGEVYEIDTPNGAVMLLAPGDYRVDADVSRNAAMLTVFSGSAEVTSNGSTFPVEQRRTVWFTDGYAPDFRPENPPDDFDRFTAERTRREDSLPPSRHMNPGMVGGDDLETYGTWRETPEYGAVWVPPVPPGWAPYRAGHWAWVDPWGWTWIDDAPWGFAPFHYGRWARLGGGPWVWIPGDRVVRPVYAPALVAFVGGPGFRIGIGVGGPMAAVAWFPLGPQEVFRPAYAVSPLYVRNVNVTNVTNVTVVNNVNVTNVRYMNQNAAIAAPQAAFVGGRPVATVASPVTPQMMANAQISHGAMVGPQRESVLGAGGGRATAPPAAMMARPVVTRTAPPAPPVAFAARQAAIQENGGRPLAAAQVAQIRQQQPSAVMKTAPVRASMPAGGFDRPAAAPRNRMPTATQPGQFSRPQAAAPVQPAQPMPAARPTAPAPAPAARPSNTAPPARNQRAQPKGKEAEHKKGEERR